MRAQPYKNASALVARYEQLVELVRPRALPRPISPDPDTKPAPALAAD